MWEEGKICPDCHNTAFAWCAPIQIFAIDYDAATAWAGEPSNEVNEGSECLRHRCDDRTECATHDLR